MSRSSANVLRWVYSPHLPFAALILVNLLVGGLTFQAYGASWDEPNFYTYAAAVPYAYSIRERLNGQFDLEKSFGPFAEAHKMYGPAYLLIAGLPAKVLNSVFQVNWYASWHLVNFLSFQAGIIFFYLLCLRWLNSRAAFWAALLCSTQPVLWGHAFINPKDIPFMSFFLATVYLGFRNIDSLCKPEDKEPRFLSRVIKLIYRMLPAGIAAGLLASIRILGPFAIALIALYSLLKYGWKALPGILSMSLIASLVNYLTWPFLWGNPIQNYLEVLKYMADNPVVVAVLFQGVFYRSNDLPHTYLPVTLLINLTEAVLPLFILGLGFLIWKKSFRKADWQALLAVLLWFCLPFCYVVIFTPALYDGLRHFIFVLPPIFIFAGFGLQGILDRLPRAWMQISLAVILVFPGMYGILRLFPYEYTYYNILVGGTGGAFRRFETDFWLTCYKEALEEVLKTEPAGATVYVFRQPQLAAEYATDQLIIKDLKPVRNQVPPGSLMLFTTRFDDDLNVRYYEPLYMSVGREGADFCIVRQAGE